MAGLNGKCIDQVMLKEGIQAHILFTEPSREEHVVRCLCKHDNTTEIAGFPGVVESLSARYGEQVIWAMARQLTLG